MKTKKYLVFITAFCMIFSSVLILKFYCKGIKLGYDITLAMFGSSSLGLIMSLIEYLCERKNSMEKFFVEADNILIELRKAKPVVTDVPENILHNCFLEERHNNAVEKFGVESENPMGWQMEHKAQSAYISWLKSTKYKDFSNCNITNFDEIYNQEISKYKSYFSSIFDNYIEISRINLSGLDNAYSNLDFMFSNCKTRKNAYENIYDKIRSIKHMLCIKAFHFNLLKNGSDNFIQCVSLAREVSNELFEVEIEDKNDFRYEAIYRKAVYDIEKDLEEFRLKMYHTKNSEPIERYAVQYTLIGYPNSNGNDSQCP